MNVLNTGIKDSKQIPQNFDYRIHNESLITLEDLKEALIHPGWSFLFAKRNIPGSDIEALQAKAGCEDPHCAYWFAKYIPNADIKYCQEYACEDPKWAYFFALYVPGADIQYCEQYCFKYKYNYNKNYMPNILSKDTNITGMI